MAGVSGKKVTTDNYANVAYGSVTESAANTLTFSQVQMGVGLFQGIAMLIHRVQWHPTSTALRELVAATDEMQLALTTSNRLAAIYDVNDPAIIAVKRLVAIGVATGSYELPLMSDFTMLPGGGKLVPANPLWVGCKMGGAAAAATIRIQIDFTFVTLDDKDYLELLQAMYPANIS